MIFRALTRSHLVLRIIQSTVSDGYAMRWDDGNGSTYFSPRKRSLKCLQSFLSFPFCVPLFRSTQYSKCYGQNGIFSSSFGSTRFPFLSRKPGCANGTVSELGKVYRTFLLIKLSSRLMRMPDDSLLQLETSIHFHIISFQSHKVSLVS